MSGSEQTTTAAAIGKAGSTIELIAGAPGPVQEMTGATNWSAIAAGYGHTVALKSDGTLWTWGVNNNGQLGDETWEQNRYTPVQQSTGATNWSAIAAGYYHTVALK